MHWKFSVLSPVVALNEDFTKKLFSLVSAACQGLDSAIVPTLDSNNKYMVVWKV